MKQLKRLSLTELSDRELKDRQMNQLKGGDNIYCTQNVEHKLLRSQTLNLNGNRCSIRYKLIYVLYERINCHLMTINPFESIY